VEEQSVSCADIGSTSHEMVTAMNKLRVQLLVMKINIHDGNAVLFQ
jgi:hypothetical protein